MRTLGKIVYLITVLLLKTYILFAQKSEIMKIVDFHGIEITQMNMKASKKYIEQHRGVKDAGLSQEIGSTIYVFPDSSVLIDIGVRGDLFKNATDARKYREIILEKIERERLSKFHFQDDFVEKVDSLVKVFVDQKGVNLDFSDFNSIENLDRIVRRIKISDQGVYAVVGEFIRRNVPQGRWSANKNLGHIVSPFVYDNSFRYFDVMETTLEVLRSKGEITFKKRVFEEINKKDAPVDWKKKQ